MMLVELPSGDWAVEPTGELFDKTIAFRLPTSKYVELIPFIECFPTQRVGDAIRWLLYNEEVQAVMRRYISESTERVVRGAVPR